MLGETPVHADGVWKLQNDSTKEMTAQVSKCSPVPAVYFLPVLQLCFFFFPHKSIFFVPAVAVLICTTSYVFVVFFGAGVLEDLFFL